MLAGLGTAIVSVGEGGSHYPVIRIDNQRGARLATDFLLDLGHRRIGLISGPLEDPMRFRVAKDRWAGWAEALKARDVRVDDGVVAIADFRMGDGVDGMTDLLLQTPGLTAVVCMSDEMAVGALRVLADQRVRVPQDISVIGFDDQEVAEHIGLTTVHQPMVELGVRAADVLFRVLRGEPQTGFPRVLPVSLVVRETTAPPRCR
jgi:LacI family repressor for deo operon, udp, cdd, tsx, nupC, and nupG